MNSLLIFGAAVAALLPQADATAKVDTTPGSIAGSFMWEGDRPEPKPDLVIKEEESKGCKHGPEGMNTKPDTLLIDEQGGVANVVVTLAVKDAVPTPPADAVALDQHGCRFDPHVLVLPVGSKLRFDNSDETNHNVHTYPKKNQAVNKNIAGGTNFEQLLDKAEVFEIKCDIHSWMKSYVFVTDESHFALTGKDGSFKIEGVPPGTYKLSWWHEELGKGKTEDVVVEAGKVANVAQKLGAKADAGGGRRRR